MSVWQFYALRLFPSRIWVHRELPLKDVTLGPALSGPQTMTATLSPDVASLETEDGQPLLTEWNTLVLAEADGVIRGGGILSQSTFTGSEWALTITGHYTHFSGASMTGTLSYGGDNTSGRDVNGPEASVGVSPIQTVADLVAQAQSRPNADLGITVTGDTTSKYKYAYWHNVPDIYDYSPDATTTITTDGAKTVGSFTFQNVTITGTGYTKKRKTDSHGSAVAKPTAAQQAKAGNIYFDDYVYWYENPDIAELINSYATEAPFDFIEQIAWADDTKEDVVLSLRVGYPRLGRRRDDLAFVEGENVVIPTPLDSGGTDYVNAITALGSGDGKDQLRVQVSRDDGRLRREATITDTSITDTTKLKAWATDQLNLRSGLANLSQVIVRQHANAPIGSYDIGDDIPVDITSGWAKDQRVWVRITEMSTEIATNLTTLTVKLSSSFSYAPASSTTS